MRGAGSPGDGGRRARRRHVADLSAGGLCRDRRTGRADDRSGAVRRQLHQPHAVRRRSAAGEHRRADRDLAPFGRAGGNLSFEAGRPGQLGQARPGQSPRSRPRGRRASRSPPTCTPIRPAATGLAASMPPWVQDGGNEAMLERLKDPATVARIKREMVQPGANWENLYLHAGPEGVLLASLTEPSLKPLIGKTVAEVAKHARRQPRAGGDRPRARRPGPHRARSIS